VFAQHLSLAVLALQPAQSGTHYPLASSVLPLQTLSVASLKLTAFSRPTAPPSGSAKCLRFGQWLILCTLNMHLLTYLLTYFCCIQVERERSLCAEMCKALRFAVRCSSAAATIPVHPTSSSSSSSSRPSYAAASAAGGSVASPPAPLTTAVSTRPPPLRRTHSLRGRYVT